MQINQNIFRAYDIRGIASEDLSDEFVTSLGSALSHKIKKLGLKQVAVEMWVWCPRHYFISRLRNSILRMES